MPLAKFLDPKFDLVFKKIFGAEKNKTILIHFLNDMMELSEGKTIKEVTLLNPTQSPATVDGKQTTLDLLCADEEGVQYIVEMQVARYTYFAKRAQYYAAQAYVNQIEGRDDYHNLKKVFFLAIVDFEMFPNEESYRSSHQTLNVESHVHHLQDFNFCFLELPKFKKGFHELSTNLERWAYFFKYAPTAPPEEFDQMAVSYPIIRKAYTALVESFFTEEQLRVYQKECDIQSSLKSAHREIKEEGKIEVAKKMILKGLDLQTVKECTDLPDEEIAFLYASIDMPQKNFENPPLGGFVVRETVSEYRVSGDSEIDEVSALNAVSLRAAHAFAGF